MKTTRHLCRILTALAVLAGIRGIVAQSGNTLLLPFPAEVKPGESAAPVSPGPVPGREAGVPAPAAEDTRRALELADTFLRRQQSEVANSVPRRGMMPVRVPARADIPGRIIARGSQTRPPLITLAAPQVEAPPLDPNAGPSSELLPLPGEESSGAPDASVLPDASAMLPPGQPMQTEGDSAPLPVEGSLPDSGTNAVSRDELAPGPAYGGIETQDRRGPVFRVNGAEAIKVARSRGYKFTPAGGIGPRDGNHTAASQFPNLLTSEVHGTRMSQLRPPSNWKMEETSNTFFMFCDASYSAVRLAPGWRIRGIRLDGPAWRWVACPRSGANTASFSIRIHAYKEQEHASSVQLAGLTLEGPEGATDWEDAFPDLKNSSSPVPSSALAKSGDTPPDTSASKNAAAEPPLPQ